jgi:4-hydroxybenzoate polyprenyltransferase
MKIPKKIEKIIEFLEKGPITIKTFLISFVTIIGVRYIIESMLFGFKAYDFSFLMGSLVYGTFLFFLMTYVAILTFLVIFTKEKISKVATFLLWGHWIVVLPPIIDKIIFGEKDFWSFYLFDSARGLLERFFYFFGDNPSFGITYGTRIEIVLAMLGLGAYIGIKKRSYLKGFVGVLSVYSILYLFAVFPSLLTFLIEGIQGENILKLKSSDIAVTFLTPLEIFDFEKKPMKIVLHAKTSLFYTLFLFGNLVLLQFILNKEKFYALVKNIRYPQMFFNFGLFFIGLGMGCFYFKENISRDIFSFLVVVNLLISIFCAWFYSVFINDIEDEKIDEVTNRERPLIKKIFLKEEYKDIALVPMFFSLLTAIVVGAKFFLIMVVYLLITWIYSCQPLRLKRLVFISSIVSASASLLFLFMGFIVFSADQSLIEFPWKIAAFLFVVYSFLIPIKDLKDIEGDKKNGVTTIPTLLGEEKARFLFGIVIFISYLGSVVVLNEKRLWLAAVIFGSINYWILNNKKIKIKHLNWWVLATIFLYGTLLVAITFF